MTCRPLHAGPLAFEFDEDAASIRHLRVGVYEVVRGIYGAVRDRNWDTVVPVLRDVRVDARGDACRVTFVADCVSPDVAFSWDGEITGAPDGWCLRGSHSGPA